MRLRICPECKKAFFVPFGADRTRCPHCGVYFTDRRASKRIRQELSLRISFNGSVYAARTADFSDNGACVLLNGWQPDREAILDVNIEEFRLCRQAITVWAKQLTRTLASAGLKLL
ncbi:MAG: hypothetical protein A2054_05405 [Deltaproteobacteria bacterium GWA2_55_10]|nr:MAG: hypothetical protein A2054_05405 [Deltaproteobacteria bacterium GWA2_55_10]